MLVGYLALASVMSSLGSGGKLTDLTVHMNRVERGSAPNATGASTPASATGRARPRARPTDGGAYLCKPRVTHPSLLLVDGGVLAVGDVGLLRGDDGLDVSDMGLVFGDRNVLIDDARLRLGDVDLLLGNVHLHL